MSSFCIHFLVSDCRYISKYLTINAVSFLVKCFCSPNNGLIQFNQIRKIFQHVQCTYVVRSAHVHTGNNYVYDTNGMRDKETSKVYMYSCRA